MSFNTNENDIFFGPVTSRRLGTSLGIDLLPYSDKYCSMNCVYCECGVTKTLTTISDSSKAFPTLVQIENGFRLKMKEIGNSKIESLTYAGHGEPTLHPNFLGITKLIYNLRNEFLPKSKITLLTNSTTVNEPKIRESYKFIDKVYFKLDTVNEELFRKINRTPQEIKLQEIVDGINSFDEKRFQVLFLQSKNFDNSLDKHIEELISTFKKLKPTEIQLYSVARFPAVEEVKPILKERMEAIHQKFVSELQDTEILVF
ncbi:MAG: radical SAM protein [Calditrichaeota bacterium]|nr:MAG: radical SAM protein [Calditrichota bacterium]